MKIIYTGYSVLNEIQEAVYQARRDNKEIEKIILTPDEYVRLREDVPYLHNLNLHNLTFMVPRTSARPEDTIEIMGVRIEVEHR